MAADVSDIQWAPKADGSGSAQAERQRGLTIFLGSSKEGQALTERLAADLRGRNIVVQPWYEAFEAGFGALEELAKRLDEVDFAAFFLLPEDQQVMRGKKRLVPRDNIVFELGLFMGKLNRDRTFALVATSEPDGPVASLFSDFNGVTVMPFAESELDAVADRLAKRMDDLGPLARVPRGTHVVEQGARGRNVYDTISSAVEVAQPGDVILVRPGTYQESLHIDKPLEIIGVGVMDEGDRVTVRAKAGTTSVTYCAPGAGRLAALTIEASGAQACGLDVVKGTLSVNGCRVTGRGPLEACVRVRGAGVARIDGNEISDSEGIGVVICESGSVRLTNNLISGHGHSCVEVRDGAHPHIDGNRICKGRRSGGVWFHGQSRGTVERNDIYEHEKAGIAITEGADPCVTGNRIHNGVNAGVFVEGGGRGTIKGNDVYANSGTGIDIEDGGDPIVINNRIYDGVGGGIALRSGARGRIEQNVVRANQRAGVAFSAGSAPTAFVGNTIVDGLAEGVYDEIGVQIGDNQIFRNAHKDVTRPR